MKFMFPFSGKISVVIGVSSMILEAAVMLGIVWSSFLYNKYFL